MPEHLPLNALRAFEAAARHLSISKAAAELFVTPAAVSQQIKTLEDQLGKPLFIRLTRALALTDAGKAGLPKIQEGLAQLSDAMRSMRREQNIDILTVWATPSFASKWLMPRLNQFLELHPNIDLQLSVETNLIDTEKGTLNPQDLRRENMDIAIRFGRGVYPGCQIDKLFKSVERAIPLCSPELLTGEYPLKTPDDLQHHTLIHDVTQYEGRPSWSEWFQAFHMDEQLIDNQRALHFSQALLALDAAIKGQGVLLGIASLAAADLATGSLVMPFDLSLPMQRAYYVISLEERAHKHNVIAFRDWLLSQANR